MKLSDFNFNLPKSLIAQYPLPDRAASRLLCLNSKTGEISHDVFKKIIDLIEPNDLLVFNNTRVIPARLYGHKTTGGKVEILVERLLNDKEIVAMLKASKAPAEGSEIIFANQTKATVLDKKDQFYTLKFDKTILPFLEEHGEIPLPPYMQRSAQTLDEERYQTVYADVKGAVAAPTAGLHFSEEVLDALKAKNINMAFLTLHVGAGTFLPVRVDDVKTHKMHHEYIEVGEDICEAVKATKAKGGRIIAVGTTTVRSLETAASSGEIKPFTGDTDIFIYPGFKFNCVDAMITNFHLPESTLLMLVSAFAGRENILNAYAEAVEKEYRFFSYGDAMFIY